MKFKKVKPLKNGPVSLCILSFLYMFPSSVCQDVVLLRKQDGTMFILWLVQQQDSWRGTRDRSVHLNRHVSAKSKQDKLQMWASHEGSKSIDIKHAGQFNKHMYKASDAPLQTVTRPHRRHLRQVTITRAISRYFFFPFSDARNADSGSNTQN